MTQERNANRPRVDAYEKVLGRALYAADQPITGLLRAMTVPATIARGRIEGIDATVAQDVRGSFAFSHMKISRRSRQPLRPVVPTVDLVRATNR